MSEEGTRKSNLLFVHGFCLKKCVTVLFFTTVYTRHNLELLDYCEEMF